MHLITPTNVLFTPYHLILLFTLLFQTVKFSELGEKLFGEFI